MVQPSRMAVLGLLSCKCPKRCEAPTCACVVNGLKCTDMPSLTDCANQTQEEDPDTEEDQNDGQIDDDVDDDDFDY